MIEFRKGRYFCWKPWLCFTNETSA